MVSREHLGHRNRRLQKIYDGANAQATLTVASMHNKLCKLRN